LAHRNAYGVFRRHASPVRRQRVQVETASRGSRRFHALAKAIMPNIASSTRSLPTGVISSGSSRCSQASTSGHRSTLGCTPGGDEGATRRVALHRGETFCTKADRGTARSDTTVGAPARELQSRQRGLESSRVRPDDVLCCIAPAMTERSASSRWGHTRKRVVYQRVHAAPSGASA
jgi:hypothetical protein